MPTYLITLYYQEEAESQEAFYEAIKNKTIDELNNGNNVEIEEATEIK